MATAEQEILIRNRDARIVKYQDEVHALKARVARLEEALRAVLPALEFCNDPKYFGLAHAALAEKE